MAAAVPESTKLSVNPSLLDDIARDAGVTRLRLLHRNCNKKFRHQLVQLIDISLFALK
jgi:hypothetical protein